MKKNYLLSEREGLALAMEQLLHYNVWSATSLNKSDFEDESLLKYFEADFGSPEEHEYENIICAAVNRTVYSKNYIPHAKKKEFSKKCQRQHLDNLRMAKLTYCEAVKGMSRREAQARLKENKMAKRISIVDGTIKWGIRKGAKSGVAAGVVGLITALVPEITVPAWLVGLGTYTTISILPDKIKKPVRKFVSQAVDAVAVTAKNIAGDLAERAVGVAQKAVTTIEKIGQGAKQLWEDTKVVALQGWQTTKGVVKQIGSKVENFFGL